MRGPRDLSKALVKKDGITFIVTFKPIFTYNGDEDETMVNPN